MDRFQRARREAGSVLLSPHLVTWCHWRLPSGVKLTPLDEPALARLLEAAVSGADPLEVMPPVAGEPGRTPARLEPHGDAVEAGIWLSRAARGRGIGKQVTEALPAEARGSGTPRFTASTTADNRGARALLGGIGANLTETGGEVAAELPL
jgi:GNAT superfamily N-acetyltransferase